MYVCMYVCMYVRKNPEKLTQWEPSFDLIFFVVVLVVVLVVTVNESPAHTKYFLDSLQTVCFQLQLGTRVCFYSARTVHAQCTATVHGLETLQIPQKMAPRLQNIEKTGFMIFF